MDYDQAEEVYRQLDIQDGEITAERDLLNAALKHLRESKLRLKAAIKAARQSKAIKVPNASSIILEAAAHVVRLSEESYNNVAQTRLTGITPQPQAAEPQSVKPAQPVNVKTMESRTKTGTGKKVEPKEKAEGVTPTGGAVILAAINQTVLPPTLEDGLQVAFGDKWSDHMIPIPGGPNRIDSRKIGETIGKDGYTRKIIAQAALRLLKHKQGRYKAEHVKKTLERYSKLIPDDQVKKLQELIKLWRLDKVAA